MCIESGGDLKMKKTAFLFVCFVSILFLSPFAVFAESDSLNVKVEVKGGTGADHGDNDIVINDSVFLSFGYKLGNGENEPPVKLSDFVSTHDQDEVELDMFSHYPYLYIGVGVSGNPAEKTSVKVNFSVDGWYKGSDRTDGNKITDDSASIFLNKNSPVSVSVSDSRVSSKKEDGFLIITHDAGLQKEKVLAGYAEIDWSCHYPDAGAYSAWLTVDISTVE